MSKPPALSVVLPAYNAERYIYDAVSSILDQTWKDFELLIINDGSTDGTLDELNRFNDPRIRIITQSNQGLVGALNHGIELATAPIIARHDADDTSVQTRFEKQMSLLGDHPEIVLLGSSMRVMDDDSTYLHNHYVLLGDAELKQELFVRSPFAHGSVMFRKQAFDKAGGYLNAEHPAEDFGLWLRMAPYGAFANINEPLYTYRENTAGISVQNDKEQQAKASYIRELSWKYKKYLLPPRIRTTQYNNKEMGEIRIERIAHNILTTFRIAVRRLHFIVAMRLLVLIILDKSILRKYARLFLIKIGLKHA